MTNNDTVALCNLHDDLTFGVIEGIFLFLTHNLYSFFTVDPAKNHTLSSTDGCDTVHCMLTESWIQDHGYAPRSDWNQILIYYTVLRCLIDVLRASSIMMFEVNI